MARPRADSLKTLEFFAHYSVSWVSALGKVDFFEHYSYSVLWGSGHETLLCSSFVSLEAVKCWFFWALQCFVRFRPRNTVMLKKFQNFQTWNSRNTVMLKKFQNSGIYGQAGGRFLKILEFFEHYSVSWVSRLGKVDFFWALQCFVRFKPRNTAMLKFCEPWGCEMLVFLVSITVFCEVQATKHCNAQKKSIFHCSRNTVMLKKFQTFKEFASGLAIDARILEFLFFENSKISKPETHETL